MSENQQNSKESNQDQIDINSLEQDDHNDETLGWRIAEDIYIPPPPQVFGEYDTRGPRLRIVKIIAKNFKSYAGTVVIGPFHKCFSAIVGPNGNGKSNAIDSMLFVFGYRANKIRSKKVVELIHNSNEHPNCTSCSVSVYFDQIIDKPGQDYDIVPNSEFCISRTACKDSSTYYELNGRKVQFKQIARLLRSHCVDLDHNRFLILQGEVEQIALMKPKGQTEGDVGMLEFLEDIIGTTRYKEPLGKLFERVECTSEQREDSLRRLKAIEKSKMELEIPMQEAVQYLKGENAIIKLQHKYYQCKRYEKSEQLEKEEESKKELDEDHQKLINEMKNIQKERSDLTEEFTTKSKKWDTLQHKKDKLTVTFDEIRKKDEAYYAELIATNKRRKENAASVKSEKSKLEELQKIPEKNAKDIEECERLQKKHIADREKEEAILKTLMSGLKEKTEPLIKKRSKLEKELVTQRAKIDDAKSIYKIAKSKLDIYTSEEQTEKDKLEELKKSIKQTNEKLVECKAKLSTLESKIPATEKSLQQAQKELDDLKIRENETNTCLKGKRANYDEQKSAMNAGKSRNRIINYLMQAKREDKIRGIFGRLGDLGAIHSKFDVAISTACGPLDNIVVDTVNTATECINFLRENDLGRATFIALEKQQRFAQQCREKIRTPENVPRLFDLIRVEDERILPAFYYALQNTLVANDLDQATRIAYGAQRYRVVTLKGELIELSGIMSGGGRQMMRGRMGQKVTRSEPTLKEIEKLQNDLDNLYQEYNQIKMQQQPLQNQIQALSTALQEMVVDRDRCVIEINQLSAGEPIMRKQLKEQQKKTIEAVCCPIKVQQLTKTVNEAEEKLKNIEESSKENEHNVVRLNQEIDEISGNRVKEQQKKITTLSKSIDKTKGEICRLQVDIKTSERNSKKAEQRIATLENNIKKCEERIREIQKEKTECEESGKKIMDYLKQLQEQLTEKDELSVIFKENLEKLHSRESKMKVIKIDLDQKLSEKNKLVKELKQQIPELTKSLQILKLQDIPDQETNPLVELTSTQLQELDTKTIAAQLHRAKEALPKNIPNMQIIEQYNEQNNLYLKRSEQLQKITDERNSLREMYTLAVRRRMQEFNDGFSLITGKLKEMYRMITLGGDAELELVDSLDPFSEGIVFSVRPPKKSWKYIQNLSGGEKTLSSLALVFALHHYKPTPVYFMDEIDAALDFKNVSIVASYIKERTKNAQFIVISHRSDMFELADYLVGIYKIYNCSKCAVVDVKKFSKKVGVTEPNSNNNYIKPVAHSQPNLVINNITNSALNRIAPIPSTCPEVNNRNKENTTTNGNQEHDNDFTLQEHLGDISLPPTPVKTPAQTKKRKGKRSPIPIRRKSLRRNIDTDLRETLNKFDSTNSSNENVHDTTERVLRRTPRNLGKGKLSEDTVSSEASSRKRRKQ